MTAATVLLAAADCGDGITWPQVALAAIGALSGFGLLWLLIRG